MAKALSSVPANVPRQTWDALRKRVHAEYEWPRIADQTVRLYRDSLRGRGDPASVRDRNGMSTGTRDDSGDRAIRSPH